MKLILVLHLFHFRIPTSSPLGDPGMASTAALLGLHSHSRPELPPTHPLSPTYLALHSSPTSSLRLASHADYLSAAAAAQRLGELQQATQASLDVPFSLDGKLKIVIFEQFDHINLPQHHNSWKYDLCTHLFVCYCCFFSSWSQNNLQIFMVLPSWVTWWHRASHHIKIHKLVFTAQWASTIQHRVFHKMSCFLTTICYDASTNILETPFITLSCLNTILRCIYVTSKVYSVSLLNMNLIHFQPGT